MRNAALAVIVTCASLVASCSTNESATNNAPAPRLQVATKRMPDGKEWTTENLATATGESYCYGAEENCRRYGRLYTWESARRGCESLGAGFRLPTDAEWRALAGISGGIGDGSGGEGQAAYKDLMSEGRAGFNARLGGNRSPGGQYDRFEAHGFYWTSSEGTSGNGVFYNFGKGGSVLNRQPGGDKQMAASVRCIKD